jgi:sulfur-oxidizing protein SoxX
MTRTLQWSLVVAPVLIALGCAAFPDEATTRETAESMISRSFTAPDSKLLKRLSQDRAQMICSKIAGVPLSQEEAAEVVNLSRASIRYPASGKLTGDWKLGERLAHDGAGDRIQYGQLEQRKENGGLCQNCHALEPGEINVGNVGPSLTRYGAQRGQAEAVVKYTYEHIYNAWAFFPCSNMPRLGATAHLTPEQISHVVAYLIDAQSPLNR